MALSVVTCSPPPPSATIEAIEAIEPHDEDREGKAVLHIPPLSTHRHRDAHAAHTYDYIAHESVDKNAIECTLMSPCRIRSNIVIPAADFAGLEAAEGR